mmetsp:Transcript_52330/g.147335  ORF Transcript_52330/g.147335 Transcript_52330/m.147335 type:complete len:573 (+) Transcript_52330:112-1830(+)
MGDGGGGLTFEGATAGYEEDPAAKLCNETCVAMFKILHDQRPGMFNRIFEIGSGTGGTSSFLIPSVNPLTSTYVFSDLSQAFLTNARLRFSLKFPFVEYAIFNGDKHPGDQGFHQYDRDQILSTNCIHATMHLASTLATCHTLLGPGGHLVFNEVQNGGAIGEDLTFGLTDGWWLLTDSERRVTYPLMRAPEWLNLFTSCCFQNIWHTPDAGHVFSQQAVYCARVGPNNMELTDHSPPPVTKMDPNASYLITGAVGGLGLVSALVMLERGARQLHFVSRRDRVPTEAMQWFARLAQSSLTIKRERCNVSKGTEVQRCFIDEKDSPPCQGLIHGAGVLSDGTIVRQTRSKYQEVFGPKAFGSWHTAVHTASKTHCMQVHVTFASCAGFLGSNGQSNHSSANVCLDSQMEFQSWRGMPGASVSWGAVAEVGYAARHSLSDASNQSSVSFDHTWAVLDNLQFMPKDCVAINPNTQFMGYGRAPMAAAIFTGAAGRFRKIGPVKAPKSAARSSLTAAGFASLAEGGGDEEEEEVADDPQSMEFRAVYEAMKELHDLAVGGKLGLAAEPAMWQQEVC